MSTERNAVDFSMHGFAGTPDDIGYLSFRYAMDMINNAGNSAESQTQSGENPATDPSQEAQDSSTPGDAA